VRRLKTILWLVVVALLAGIYFYETHEEKEGRILELEKRRLFQIGPAQIKVMRLKRGRQSVLFEREQESGKNLWYIKSPIKAKADPETVKEILNTLASLHYERLISTEEPEDMGQFGLDHPKLTVSIIFENGEGILEIGRKTPIGDAYYAKREGRPEVFTIPDHVVATLDRDLFELRNKRLFNVSYGQVEEVLLWRDSKRWRFIRRDGRWYLEEPKHLSEKVIDQERVTTIIRSFIEAKATSFEEGERGALAAMGLQKPKAGVAIKAQEAVEQLLFGDPFPGHKSKIYARVLPQGMVVTVDTWLFRQIPLHENLFLATM